jgi:hypothetical protein
MTGLTMNDFTKQKSAIHESMMRIVEMLDKDVYTEEFAFKQLTLLESKLTQIEQEEDNYNLADYREIY